MGVTEVDRDPAGCGEFGVPSHLDAAVQVNVLRIVSGIRANASTAAVTNGAAGCVVHGQHEHVAAVPLDEGDSGGCGRSGR